MKKEYEKPEVEVLELVTEAIAKETGSGAGSGDLEDFSSDIVWS